jgi:transcriptional regulator with XRE-family HTH domain
MEINKHGARLREVRKAKKLTQAQLASKAGVSQGTIGNIESGLRGYGESLVDIAAALEVSPDVLRGQTGDYSSDASQTLQLVKQDAQQYNTIRQMDRLIELAILFEQSSEDGQEFILSSARSAEKATGARWKKVGNKS